MPTRDGKLGVGVSGIGWCAAQHITAFQKNPHVRVTWLHGRGYRARAATLEKHDLSLPEARLTTRYEDLLEAADVDIVSIATPNDLHAGQAVAAARAGKHIVLEKPTGLDEQELIGIRDAVARRRRAHDRVLRAALQPVSEVRALVARVGLARRMRFARTQYLSRVTDWYAGWDWVRTRASGRSHLLAAGCHAVDALRWCSGREVVEVSAFHTHFTEGYEWPTSILVERAARGGALGHVTSSTDFMLPYNFQGRADGRRATLRQD